MQDAYADPSKLSARGGIHAFRRPGPGFHDRMLDLVDWSSAATVLDVGCGNAIYLDRLLSRLPQQSAVIGVDLSSGMLVAAPHPTGRIVGDVEGLPIRSAAADVVLALHMLYHAPHPVEAVRELRRVTRDGGLVVVSTNGPEHLQELIALGDNRVPRGSRVLGLEPAGVLLSDVFDSVVRHDFRDELRVPDAEPIAAYLRSTLSLGGDAAVLAQVERRVREVISRDGALQITVQPGVLLCR